MQVGGDVGFGGVDREHGAVGRHGLHEPGAGGDECGRVVEGEDSGDVGGGDFPDGVADQVVGGQVVVLQESEQGGLEGEQRGLGIEGLVEQSGVGLSWAAHMTSRSGVSRWGSR